MRTLNRNKTIVWITPFSGMSDYVDGDGYKTGEIVKTFGTPIKSSLSIYPSNGKIVEELFGKNANIDMVAVTASDEPIIGKFDLIFLDAPVKDYEKTYDYSINIINKSINGVSYGLLRNTNG